MKTRRDKPDQSEAALHAAVAHYLTLALPGDAVFHHSPQENKAHVAHRVKLKKMGTRTGWPDLEIIHGGRFHAIELKAARGRLTSAQKDILTVLGHCGAKVAVCRSLADVEAILRRWQIPVKARAAA